MNLNIPWKLKSIVFRFIDLTSAKSILYFLQKYVSRRSRIGNNGSSLHWVQHRETIRKFALGGVLFEFGAGKSLIQNLFLSLEVKKQVVVDLNSMLDLKLAEAARVFLSSQGQCESRGEITSIQALRDYGIEYIAPYDAAATDFDDHSIDICISTNTLEHIPKISIKNIFQELHRILKVSGVVSLQIDYSDHYAHTDKSISILNYLKYNEVQWQKFNHSCHYQNRLRHYEYLELFVSCGFEIIEDTPHYAKINNFAELEEMYTQSPVSWAATSGYIVLRKKS